MANETPQRNHLSLIPYFPAESSEVVLRHGSSVVVYDQRSKQLSLQDASNSSAVELADCPYCHRPLRGEGYDVDDNEEEDVHPPTPGPGSEAQFMNPAYFRMLHHSGSYSGETSRPPSPHRGITGTPSGVPEDRKRTLRSWNNDVGQGQHHLVPPEGSEFVGSAPQSPPGPHHISSTAFSQNYFKTFFVEEGELGRGGKGVVLLVRHVLDGVHLGHFACKRVPVGDDHEWLEKVLVEVQLLQNLSHQNLVSYRHVWLEDYKLTTFGPSVPCAFILQQYCNGGDLLHYILDPAKTQVTTQQLKERMRRRSKGQPEPPHDLNGPRRMHFDEVFSFFKDITAGLHHLHANGYIHRDLKPSNCLLHKTGSRIRVLVSDFGEVQAVNVARKSSGATGTISYCAPEVLRRDPSTGDFGNFTTKSDIFSLGMIVYFMCFARSPYRNADNMHEENENVDRLREEITLWPGFNDSQRLRADLPDKLYKFLRRLLSLDPSARPGTEEILHGIGASSEFEDHQSFPTGPFDDVRSRISSADSPAAGSPLRGPRKPQSATTAFHPAPRSPTRRRASSPLVSPECPSPQAMERSGSLGSVVVRPRLLSKSPSRSQSRSRSLSPGASGADMARQSSTQSARLMLPAPPRTTPLFEFPPSRLSPVLQTLSLSVKIAFFLFKYVSLTSPCAPYSVDPRIAYPLLAVATLDLTLGLVSWGMLGSIGLLGVHVAVVRWAWVGRWLCMRGAGIIY
ncbi:kinase-like protein [Eremomyces bilateralis CBS 781.70]|uniref:non-specific serine/threonine protein kinase n=1 Tax=Eremomyces bilateralis CBS 781.70 TaxID=1392243 RepID=A0A6G1G254_9PEZI|nr:kinase-like protein [Eremomyces bilateralis CBS 781.70]KAF1812123.1 kinase-like protein [Eremomyces bilateralis CBS 781.70]